MLLCPNTFGPLERATCVVILTLFTRFVCKYPEIKVAETCLHLVNCHQPTLAHSRLDPVGNSEAAPCSAPPLADQGGSPDSPELHRATRPP